VANQILVRLLQLGKNMIAKPNEANSAAETEQTASSAGPPWPQGCCSGISSALAVWMVTITGVLVFVLDSETDAEGENEQVSPEGKPLHANMMLPVNPFTAFTVTARLPAPPGFVTVTAGLVELR